MKNVGPLCGRGLLNASWKMFDHFARVENAGWEMELFVGWKVSEQIAGVENVRWK